MKIFLNLLPVAAGCCWGATGVFVRTLSQSGFDNSTIIFSRVSVCSIMIFVMLFFKNRNNLKIALKDFPFFVCYSLSGCLLMNLCYNTAINLLNLSLAGVLLSLCPVFVLIFSRFLFGEKITPLKFACMIAAICGCILISGVFEDGQNSQLSLVGILCGLGSALCYAIFTVNSKQLSRKNYDSITITFYFFLITTIAVLPFVQWENIASFTVAAPIRNIAFYILHAIIASFLPNYLFNLSIANMDPGKVSILSGGSEPVAAMIFGALIYSELVSLPEAVGMIITVTSIAFLTKHSDKTI